MDLHTESHDALDISGGGVVLEYTYTGTTPRSVISRIDLGSDDAPIVGGGQYTLQVSVNGRRLSPDSGVTVDSGVTQTTMQSRTILLRTNDTIAVTVVGLGGDTAIDTDAVLTDLTPVTASEIYGTGAVAVDHNYGGTDTYRAMTAEGAAVDNAQIQAFLATDYDAGNASAAFVKGEVRTKVDGRWAGPMMLDPGDYTLVFFKQGSFRASTAALTVS